MEPVGRAWVDGMHRRHDWQAIDLEPLIIFTAYIGNTDSRLRAQLDRLVHRQRPFRFRVSPSQPGAGCEPFTAEFVRRWYENRRHRFGATA